MNVLFVCRGNVGRSQAAAAYFKRYFPDDITDSAGTIAAESSLQIGDMPGARGIVAARQEDGIDITHNHPKKLTKAMLANFEIVVSMARLEDSPIWLTTNPKFIFWDIIDLKDLSLEQTRAPRDQIKRLVRGLGATER